MTAFIIHKNIIWCKQLIHCWDQALPRQVQPQVQEIGTTGAPQSASCWCFPFVIVSPKNMSLLKMAGCSNNRYGQGLPREWFAGNVIARPQTSLKKQVPRDECVQKWIKEKRSWFPGSQVTHKSNQWTRNPATKIHNVIQPVPLRSTFYWCTVEKQ